MNLELFVMFSLLLFSVGLYGVLTRRNLIAVLIGVELMLNAASINFMAFGAHHASDPTMGPIFVLFIIGLAAAEVAIALSIVLSVYRVRKAIRVEQLTELKG